MHFQEFRELVHVRGLLEIGHGDDIHTMEIGECYKSGFLYFFLSVSWYLIIYQDTPANDMVLAIQSRRQ